MKYVLFVPDGMADLPNADLNGQTPWQAAKTPNFDSLAQKSLVGSVLTVPAGMYPGSDVANMSIMGYDPRKYYTGRGPIEAVAMGVPLDSGDVAFRCSLVTCDGETMIDYSSDHISTPEATELIAEVQAKLGSSTVKFYPGVQYRHIMAWRGGTIDLKTTAPHDITGKQIAEHLPTGERDAQLRQLMFDSLEILENHPVNKRRRDQGKKPGSMIWLWGQGYAPSLPNFLSEFGKVGGVISAVDVVRGLARAASLKIVNVPGATGYIDTDYNAKMRYAVDALDGGLDFVFVHVEATDEAGHEKNLDHKIGAIQDIDSLMVGPLIEAMKKRDDLRLLIVPDHKTPVALGVHDEGPVPFLLFDSTESRRNTVPFDERALESAKTYVDKGTDLIRMLFAK